MMEKFLHLLLALLLDAKKRIERNDDASDKREVDPESDFELREIKGDIREDGKNNDDHEDGFKTNHETKQIPQ
jgi:hypothetical protein